MPLVKSILLLCLALLPSIGLSQNSSLQLNYSVKDNSLSLNSHQVKFKTILGLLSLKSGIQTAIHPDVDKKISLVINKLPLQQAIKNLCNGFNCITYFNHNSKINENIITRLEVLPKGKHQLLMLTETIPLANEMNIHAKKHQTAKYSRLQARLESRLNNLPEEIRESVSEEYLHKITHFKNKQLEREHSHTERKKDKKRREDYRHAMDEKLKKRDPKRYALRQQRKESQIQRH